MTNVRETGAGVGERKNMRPRTSGGAAVSDRIAAIFSIDGRGYDVVLTGECLSRTLLLGERKVKKSGSFLKRLRGKDNGQSKEDEDNWNINFSDILGVTMKRKYNTNPQTGPCVGVAVHTYRVNKRKGHLKVRVVLLEHPSEVLCLFWISQIQHQTDRFKERPRSIKVFLQPHAGLNNARYLYNHEVLPLFEAARIKVDITDVQHNEHIKQEMTHLDLSQYDSIVCIGGDGTVNKVVSELLTKVQKDNDVTLKPGCCVIRPTIPVGIIPLGTTNDIVHSVHGVSSIATAVIHIILGHRVSVDICSVYQKGKFIQFAFNSHYGFFGNATRFMHRYKVIGEKKVEAAVLKALTTSKFRSYECEIGYIPAETEEDSQAFNYTLCSSDCKMCSSEKPETTLLQPLGLSNTSSGIRALNNAEPEDSRWRFIKTDVVSVSVLSIAGMSELAPMGMGIYTHLADGCVDLVLVKNTDRKQFVRYLRRHGNSKNQFDLPFIECHRCEEVRVRTCTQAQQSWTNDNKGYSETECKKVSQKSDMTVEVIDDLDSSDADDTSSVSANDTRQRPSAGSAEIFTTTKSQIKKSESREVKDETKRKSAWSIDHQLHDGDELHFRLHPSAVFLQGLGVSPDYAPDQVKLSCLSMF